MKVLKIFSIILLPALIILSGGCEENESNGRLVLKITDAPFPIEVISEANITITKIEARQKDSKEDSPYILLCDDTLQFNLVDLRNGITGELVDMEVPPGYYDLIRLYTGDAGIKFFTGEEFDMKVPSGEQTGIKLKIDTEVRVEGGLTTELILDFDLPKSFVPKGNIDTPAGINGFNFKPVIKVINSSSTGRVDGKVKDSDANPVEYASVWVENDTVVASTFSDDFGYHNIIGIPTGLYKLYCAKPDYDTVSTDLVIIEANRTTKNFTLSKTK